MSIESQKNPNFTVRSGFNYRSVDAECMFLEDEGEVEGRGGRAGEWEVKDESLTRRCQTHFDLRATYSLY